MTPPKKGPRKKSARPQKSRGNKGAAKKKAPEPEGEDPEVEINPLNGHPFSPEFIAARFQPGQSGNAGGLSKGRKSLLTCMEDVLDEILVDPETQQPVEHAEVDGVMIKRQALARLLVEGALRRRPDRQILEIVTSRVMPKPTVIDATIETTNPKLREAMGSLDADGREALRLALGQLGATSPLDDEPASPDDPVH